MGMIVNKLCVVGYGDHASKACDDRREEGAPLLQDPAPTKQPDQQENEGYNGLAESGGTTQETNANSRSELVPSSKN